MKRGLTTSQHRALQGLQGLKYRLYSLPIPEHLPQPAPEEMVVRYEGEHYDLYLVKDRDGKTVRRHCLPHKHDLANVI